jgi:DNA-binding NarL/FixJ family response regulator
MQDDPTPPVVTQPVVRVSNADGCTFALLSEWLAGAGYRVVSDIGAPAAKATVSIVDVPFSRTGAAEIIQGVSHRHPGEPIIVLSATFLSSVACGGGCAKRLGVAGVLPKPLSRAALLTAVERFAPRGS